MITEAVTDLNSLTQTRSAPPIRYFGAEHVATKEFFWGTQRAMPPEKTLARIRPHFHEVGVTRLADVTGLDRLGVPIWCSIRPYSKTLAVDSGKGATPVAAATSAAMEAIERSVAETFDDVVLEARYEDVADRAGFGPYEHPVYRDAVWSPDTIYQWTSGWDILSDREVLLPQMLIGLANRDVGLRSYWWTASSNGLASGNHFPEALCAALYELIERDATACWQVAIEQGLTPAYLDTSTIDQPVIRGLIDQLFQAGVVPELLWCPNELGVPVFISFVRDLEIPELGVYKGYGCHLNPEIAMIRAVTEAVQARTLIIAGSRDDLFRATFRVLRASAAHTGTHFQGARTISAPNIADSSTSSFHGDVAVLIDRLVSHGFDRILVRALPADHLEVSVVRVFVPGLEGYRFPWIAAGSRARTFDPSSLFV